MRAVLITAGATRNPLDAIRYISAHSSGRTGVGIAEQLSAQQPVTLLGSAEACLRARGAYTTAEFTSTRDLMAQMQRWAEANPDGVIVHAAAVGDYEADAGAAKIPSGQDTLLLRLTPTPKIIDRIQSWAPDGRLVSFKAASPETSDADLLTIAQRQRQRTHSDLVFANVIGRLRRGVLLLGEDGPRWHDRRQDAIHALIKTISAWG